jgi:hypothetical protein
MKQSFIGLMMATSLAILPVTAGAHHSFAAEYDGGQPLDLVGVITRVDQQNPHGFFYLNVRSANGRVTNWALETPGPNQLIRNGFTRQMYEAMVDQDEQVRVRAYPAKDGSKRAFAETLTRADGVTVITISVGGVDGAVGRAPREGVVTVGGEPVPEADGGGGPGGRGGPQ